MTRLLRLPAQGCRHFLRGRCHYREFLNPGYEQGFKCAVIIRLHGLYDSFLSQAEAFGLSDSAAAAIWERRFRELCREDTGCQDHEPDDRASFPGCALCLGDVCLLKLPECQGRCPEFTPKTRD